MENKSVNKGLNESTSSHHESVQKKEISELLLEKQPGMFLHRITSAPNPVLIDSFSIPHPIFTSEPILKSKYSEKLSNIDITTTEIQPFLPKKQTVKPHVCVWKHLSKEDMLFLGTLKPEIGNEDIYKFFASKFPPEEPEEVMGILLVLLCEVLRFCRPPKSAEILEPEECKDALIHFCMMYLRNLPILHLVIFASDEIQLHWEPEPEIIITEETEDVLKDKKKKDKKKK